MDRQFNEFPLSLDTAKDRRFKILDMEKTGDELKSLSARASRRPHTCFHLTGVTDFDTFIFGGEEHRTRP